MALGTLIGKVLVRSPMLSIEEHMQLMLKTVEQVALFMTASQKGDWHQAEKIQHHIAALDQQANDIKQQFRRQMSGRLLVPIARSDLLDLMVAQDKIAKCAKDIAGLMLGRQMAFPRKLDKQMIGFVELAVQSTNAALDAIKSTHNLFRSGFAAQESREVDRNIVDVERLERRSDKVQAKLRSRLYKLESDLSAVDVMFMYQVIVWLGNIPDRAETVAHKLLLISKS